MPDTLVKTRAGEPAATPNGPPGTARAASARGAKTSAVAATAPILSPEDFRLIGSTLNGDHWQADIAKAIGCSKSQVTRYLNKTRDLNPMVARNLQFIINERITALTRLMDLPGMPHAGSPETTQALQTVTTTLAALPGQQPPREI